MCVCAFVCVRVCVRRILSIFARPVVVGERANKSVYVLFVCVCVSVGVCVDVSMYVCVSVTRHTHMCNMTRAYM